MHEIEDNHTNFERRNSDRDEIVDNNTAWEANKGCPNSNSHKERQDKSRLQVHRCRMNFVSVRFSSV